MKKNKRLKSKWIKVKIQVNFRDKFYKSQKLTLSEKLNAINTLRF